MLFPFFPVVFFCFVFCIRTLGYFFLALGLFPRATRCFKKIFSVTPSVEKIRFYVQRRTAGVRTRSRGIRFGVSPLTKTPTSVVCGRCRSEVSACACSHHLERHLLLRHPQPPLSCCHSIPFLGSLFSVSELIYRWVFAPVPCVAVACALSFIFGQRRSYFLLASVVAPA